ncbi:glycosyltransferase [Rufibacter soli]
MEEYIRGVSLIICCYNSATRLPKTLGHLFSQVVPQGILWEIIVVNNASADNTEDIAQDLYASSQSAIPFRVINEHQPGLNFARIAGLQASAYEYMIWVDDDNWLQSDYVENAYHIMEGNNQIGVLGGIGIPVLEVTAPAWFEKYQLAYAAGKQANQSGEIKDYGFLYGAGAVIRKSAWLEVLKAGFQSILTDRRGSDLLCGGDVELENAMRLAGYKLWYDERLVFQHFIPKERLNWDFILRSTKGSGESDISGAVFYFIFRNSDLNDTRFKYLYYKRLVWLLGQVMKSPVSFYRFMFNKYGTQDWNVIEVNRNVANLLSSFKNRKTAFFAFNNITSFRRNIQYNLVGKEK